MRMTITQIIANARDYKVKEDCVYKRILHNLAHRTDSHKIDFFKSAFLVQIFQFQTVSLVGQMSNN